MPRRVLRSFVLAAGIALPLFATTSTTTQDLSIAIDPAWALILPGTAALTHGQTAFQPFQVTIPVNYRARTTPAGSGKITLQVTSDFTPAGGPSVSTGALTYSCSSATLGTPCSGSQTPSTSIQTPVLTLPASACTGGGGGCSGSDPNSVNLTFILTDDPSYATGTYSVNVTLTISTI